MNTRILRSGCAPHPGARSTIVLPVSHYVDWIVREVIGYSFERATCRERYGKR